MPIISVNSKSAKKSFDKWGLWSVAAFLGAFGALGLCQGLVKDDRNFCLVPYILLLVTSTVSSIVAGTRGSKWWLLLSLLAAVLAAQATLALLVE
jgi:hypothetical protein